MGRMETVLEKYGLKRESLTTEGHETILEFIDYEKIRRIFAQHEWTEEIKRKAVQEELLDQICGHNHRLYIIDIEKLKTETRLPQEVFNVPEKILSEIALSYRLGQEVFSSYINRTILKKIQKRNPEKYEGWIMKHDKQFKMEKVFKPEVALVNAEERMVDKTIKMVKELSAPHVVNQLASELTAALIIEIEQVTASLKNLTMQSAYSKTI